MSDRLLELWQELFQVALEVRHSVSVKHNSG
jgi:hypothetical protein